MRRRKSDLLQTLDMFSEATWRDIKKAEALGIGVMRFRREAKFKRLLKVISATGKQPISLYERAKGPFSSPAEEIAANRPLWNDLRDAFHKIKERVFIRDMIEDWEDEIWNRWEKRGSEMGRMIAPQIKGDDA